MTSAKRIEAFREIMQDTRFDLLVHKLKEWIELDEKMRGSKGSDYFPNSGLEDTLLIQLKALASKRAREHQCAAAADASSAYEHYCAAIAAERGISLKAIESSVPKSDSEHDVQDLIATLEFDVNHTRNWIGSTSSVIIPRGDIHDQKKKALEHLKKMIE